MLRSSVCWHFQMRCSCVIKADFHKHKRKCVIQGRNCRRGRQGNRPWAQGPLARVAFAKGPPSFGSGPPLLIAQISKDSGIIRGVKNS